MRHRLPALVILVWLATGCAWLRGSVNASPSLRWWLFSNFGAQRICPEMLKRSTSLALTPSGNAVGRFFPTNCGTEINDQARTLTIRMGGTGYAWTPLAGRVGFRADATIEYRFDFNMTEDAVYVWARVQRVVEGPTFQLGAVENPAANWAANNTPVGYLANTFGAGIVSSQLASGFTVIRTDEGDEFALGILSPPARPLHPFQVSAGERLTLGNETTEIHPGQVDFIGPFEVADSEQALFMTFRVAGSAVDALVLPRGTADLWREGLQLGGALGPPPQAPLDSFVIAPQSELRRKVKLAPGQYYVVVDHSDKVGSTNPPWNPLGSVGANAVAVSYVVELGDADDRF
jgi:hypothetical protein